MKKKLCPGCRSEIGTTTKTYLAVVRPGVFADCCKWCCDHGTAWENSKQGKAAFATATANQRRKYEERQNGSKHQS